MGADQGCDSATGEHRAALGPRREGAPRLEEQVVEIEQAAPGLGLRVRIDDLLQPITQIQRQTSRNGAFERVEVVPKRSDFIDQFDPRDIRCVRA
jgi:hypothetical protein